MKNTNYLLKLLSIAIVVSTVFMSCQKDEDPIVEEEKPDTQSLDDNSDAESEFDDIFSLSEDVMDANKSSMDKGGQGTLGTLGDTTCATVSIDTAYSTNGAKGRIVIDFGTTNCIGNDGKERRGKIYVDYTGRYRTVGTVITTTFDNFFVNDNQVEGVKTVTRSSSTELTIEVADAKITWTDATTTLWESSRTRTWTEGTATLFNIFDDVYTVNGTSSGTNRLGTTFDVEIIDVTLKLECWLSSIFYPVAGSITVTPTGADYPREVSYGDGTCDKDVTFTVNGVEYEHTLR